MSSVFFCLCASHSEYKESHCKHTVELQKFSLTDGKKNSESILWLVSWQNHQTVGSEILKQYKEGKTGSNTILR